MSELLVRVADKQSADPYIDAQMTKRGDVIAVRPDGWQWSEKEQTATFWRILRTPIPLDEAEALLAPEFPQDPQDFRQTLQRRARMVNLGFSGMSARNRRDINDDARTNSVINIPAGVFRSAISTKQKIRDPRL